MSIFCKHDWEVMIKTVAPKPNISKLGACSEYLAERLIWGVTTVLLRCKICSDLKKEEMLGTEKVNEVIR